MLKYILAGAAVLLLASAKPKKKCPSVAVDFSVLANGGRYQLKFTDAGSNVFVFDSNNGLVQSQALAPGTYTIELVQVSAADCPGFFEIAQGVYVGDLTQASASAPLKCYYEMVLQCR